MKRLRLLGLAAAVLALLGAHLLKAAAPALSLEASPDRSSFGPADFRLQLPEEQSLPPLERDVFAASDADELEPETATPPQPLAEEPPIAEVAALPSPEALAAQAAQAEMAQLKLVGVVFREGRGQAYLVKGDEVFLASEGDRAARRYVVERLAADHVQLRDPETQTSRRIVVSGE